MSNCGCCITATCIFESMPLLSHPIFQSSCDDCDKKDRKIEELERLLSTYKETAEQADYALARVLEKLEIKQ